MIALTPGHEDILIAIIGTFGIVLVATIPIIWSARGNRRAIQDTQESVADVRDHLPPNGVRLYQMVEATNDTVNEMQVQLTKTETALIEHITWAHQLSSRVRKLEDEHREGKGEP